MASQQYTIAIRTDGSNAIGMGHIATCLALAEELKKYKNVKLHFIMKNFTEGINKVKQCGYSVQTIDTSLTDEETAREVISILRKEKTDLLVTDLLEIPLDFSPLLREKGIKSVSIDILGKIKLQSDIIINRTFIEERYQHYAGNTISKFFLGSKYVVLHPQYWGLEKQLRTINPVVKNIVVCMGGGDEFNITTRIVRILDTIPEITGTIILGAAFKGESALRETLKNVRKTFIIEKDVSNMPAYFLKNDLVVCAGGLTLYELSMTGTPALVIPMNDHQLENALAFETAGSVVNAGFHTSISDEEIKQNIVALVNNVEQRKKMSLAGRSITDGRGAERIAKIIHDHLKT